MAGSCRLGDPFSPLLSVLMRHAAGCGYTSPFKRDSDPGYVCTRGGGDSGFKSGILYKWLFSRVVYILRMGSQF